ncbi:MAG: DinB family protein [Candidatus Eisenbacteria bacterium]|nr:DinB family protein [Candidatus Eisenbacteria bacterium]
MKRTRKATIGMVCPALVRERALLAATLDSFRDDEMDYRPPAPEGSHLLSVREILMHIVDADKKFVEGAVGETAYPRPELICDESVSRLAAVTEGDRDSVGIRIALERSWKGVASILDWPAEALQGKPSPGDQNSLMTLLTFTFMHHAQHRGQLWTYLELLGRVPPRDW